MRVRRASRVILLDEQERVLLLEIEDTVGQKLKQGILEPFWVTPGGGVEEGESFEDAARRELWEETGIAGAELGPWLYTREAEVIFQGESIRVHERYYLVRVPAPVIDLGNHTAQEKLDYRSHRWWTVDELRTTSEIIFPPGLADLLTQVLTGDSPSSPSFIA